MPTITPTEVNQVSRLIEVVETFLIHTSVARKPVDVNVAAGVALAELRSVKDSLGK
jgi:hypothetical protein